MFQCVNAIMNIAVYFIVSNPIGYVFEISVRQPRIGQFMCYGKKLRIYRDVFRSIHDVNKTAQIDTRLQMHLLQNSEFGTCERPILQIGPTEFIGSDVVRTVVELKPCLRKHTHGYLAPILKSGYGEIFA